MVKNLPAEKRVSMRTDLIRAGVLVIITALIWCVIYNRMSVESWQIPLAYLSNPMKGDVLVTLATTKAASEGHVWPFLFTNVPELGAPYGANWDDFPVTEKPLICLMGLLARIMGVFAAANFAVLLGHALAAVSFYAACRILNCSWPWSFAGALIFAFAQYAFGHGLHHITVLYYWHVPLCLVVSAWIIRGEGIKLGERRFIFALVVAFVTGVQNVYYTNMFAQLVLIGGLVQAWLHGWRRALSAAAVIGTMAGAFLLMNLNTIFYHLTYGGNEHAVVRNYRWLEIYGLKLVDLVIPPPDHRFPLFAAWGADHLKELVLSPGEMPPTAYMGIVGLAALTWLVIVSLRGAIIHARLPLEALLILWIFLYANVGGINGIVGTVGIQLFRATTRYSIFVLCIVLMYAANRLSTVKFKDKMLVYGAAILVVLIALWDQLPPQVSQTDLDTTAKTMASDRSFTEAIEKRLPPQAMIFQIPIMEFPESPGPGVGSYDHFRPYLYSHSLRFSFGSDKGRPLQAWQQQLGQAPFNDIVSRLESYGFAAMYVNRNAFGDKGDGLIKACQASGHNEIIESDQGDLFCVLLKPSPQPVLPNAP